MHRRCQDTGRQTSRGHRGRLPSILHTGTRRAAQQSVGTDGRCALLFSLFSVRRLPWRHQWLHHTICVPCNVLVALNRRSQERRETKVRYRLAWDALLSHPLGPCLRAPLWVGRMKTAGRREGSKDKHTRAASTHRLNRPLLRGPLCCTLHSFEYYSNLRRWLQCDILHRRRVRYPPAVVVFHSCARDRVATRRLRRRCCATDLRRFRAW